jgi:phosphatidylinositol alpha-mannosyltransferase
VRVGLVCPYDLSKPGGVQAQVRGLAGHLERVGDDVTIIAPGLPDGVDGVDLGPTISVPGNRSKAPLAIDPRLARDLRSQLRRILGPNVRQLTAVSATAAAPLPNQLEVSIVPNGVDVAAFESYVDRHPLRVCFLGRDERRKGLDVLLQAWEMVARAVPNAELLVMGADRGSDGITWAGRVDDAEKVRGLASSAIYVAPHIGGESFGVVVVEGMAAGCAVVASELGSFQDVGGDAIHYFPTRDSAALGDALISLLDDPSAVARLASAGRSRASRFDWALVAAEYRAVYQKALS